MTDLPTWPDLTARLIRGEDLSSAETAWAMDRVMGGETSPVVLAGFLTALATKGETVPELDGLASAMLEHATPIDVSRDAVDIVGTGGDRARTVNVSTMAALVIAGTGARVVKHGNRASSSASGSADLLEALGVDLALPVPAVARAADAVGITFLFANLFHPAMRFAAPTRRELAVPTAFNVLGPLTNPARPRASAIGVSSAHHAPIVAGVLAGRGTDALVFRGQDNGLDELTTTGPNDVWQVEGGRVTYETVDARELGIPACTVEDLRGAEPDHNARVARDVLDGAEGIVADTVALNAAAGLVALGRTGSGTPMERLAAGLQVARTCLADGAAARLLDRWVEFSRSERATN